MTTGSLSNSPQASESFPFFGHDDGLVIEGPDTGFRETPMTPAQLAARVPAHAIAKDIYRHANYAGVCYVELWEIIAKAIQGAVEAQTADESEVTSPAINDVLIERARQVNVEGWDAQHDDEHTDGELAAAAGIYALHNSGGLGVRDYFQQDGCDVPRDWPFHPAWWKPKDARRDLVRAAALIIAEIERIDRAAEA